MRRKPIRALNKPRGHIFGAAWDGLPAKVVKARVVRAVVADTTDAEYWARPYVGQDRLAVEVRIEYLKDYQVFYIDYEDGAVIDKLTKGRGAIQQGFKQMLVASFVPDETIAVSYGFTQK